MAPETASAAVSLLSPFDKFKFDEVKRVNCEAYFFPHFAPLLGRKFTGGEGERHTFGTCTARITPSRIKYLQTTQRQAPRLVKCVEYSEPHSLPHSKETLSKYCHEATTYGATDACDYDSIK